jgi:hypothetical protein
MQVVPSSVATFTYHTVETDWTTVLGCHSLGFIAMARCMLVTERSHNSHQHDLVLVQDALKPDNLTYLHRVRLRRNPRHSHFPWCAQCLPNTAGLKSDTWSGVA